MAHALIVDDEADFTDGLVHFLRPHDHTVGTANCLSAARLLLAERTPDLLLLDLMLPDGSGLELLDYCKNNRPTNIVIVTGHSGVKSMIGGIAGAGVSYMKKPIDPRELLGLLNSIGDSNASASEDDEDDDERRHFGVLRGESEAMQAVYAKIRQVAGTESTVFIQGESGTGKELVANALHRYSGRSGEFVPVNCGGLSRELVSSQLFGHEKGSFTGAASRHTGFFERASGGTLFLDEVTEMPMELQTQLLRVLETATILRVGGEAETPVDVRLVTATNRDPAQAVRDGVLREDLYFRLRVFPIALPPLRDRQGDIPMLASDFLDELNKKYGTAKIFSPEMLEALETHTWAGNVRELKHTVHRAYIMAEGDVIEAPSSFDDGMSNKIEGLSAVRSIADVEKDLILAAVEHFGGNKKLAAASLGVSIKTLYTRLRSYEADDTAQHS